MSCIVGILTLLSGEIRDEVLELWNYFDQMYDSKLVKSFEHPNVSYQSGICEDIDALISRLNDFDFPPKFEIEIEGFDKFTNPQNTIYMKIIKSDQLSKFYDELSNILKDNCIKTFDLYESKNWVPHITITMNDISEINFHKSFDELQKKESNWKSVLIDNVALVIMNALTHELTVFNVWKLK